MDLFQLDIITPERVVFSDEIDSVTIPTLDGVITVLAHHIFLFTALTEGELVIRKGENREYLSIAGGFAEIKGKRARILADVATYAHEIDEQRVLEAKQRAEKILKSKPKGEELISAQAAFRRSLVDLKVLHKRRKIRSSFRPPEELNQMISV